MNFYKKRLFTKTPRWLLLSTLFYIVILFTASFLKYYFILYNGFDLAIFNHTFWQTVHGNFFGSSFNPPSYFGDHFEPFLILLIPIYYSFPHPLTLLLLQTLFISASAFPLYFIAKRYLSNKWTVVIIASWLSSPFVGSLNLFEWHTISILPLLLFLLWYFFITDRLKAFLITLGIALLVREDVGITTASLALVMFFLKKENRRATLYGTITLVTSTVWTIIAIKLTGLFTVTGSYKFFAYYGWLGSTPYEIIMTMLTSPMTVFYHVFTLNTLALLFLLFLPVLYLIFLAPIFLLGLLLPLITLLLPELGGTPLIPFLHYTAWLIPSVYIGTIYGINRLITATDSRFITVLGKQNTVLLLVFWTATLYFLITLHPASFVLYKSITDYKALAHDKLTKELLLAKIPDDAVVISSAEFLTPLSGRKNIHYIRFLYNNQYQLSNMPYVFPTDIEYILYRPTDFIFYDQITRDDNFTVGHRGEKLETYIREQKFSPFIIIEDYILLSKQDKLFSYYKELEKLPENANINQNVFNNDPIVVLGWNTLKPTQDYAIGTFYLTKTKEIGEPIYFKIELQNNDSTLATVLLPPSFGLVSTDKWNENTIIESRILIPFNDVTTQEITQITLTPITIRAANSLNRFSSTSFMTDSITPVGETTTIPLY